MTASPTGARIAAANEREDIKVTASDAAGNSAAEKLKVKLRR
jgi:hypothetical protein